MTTRYTPTELMTVATEALDRAADYLRSIDRRSIEREYKGDPHDIVTVHDRRTEEIIREVLSERLPGCSIVGEEGGSTDGDPSLVCYVDPIDGTTFFASGSPFFCSTIGIEVDGELLVGAVNAPLLGWVWTTDGTSVWWNGERVEPARERQPQDCVALTYFPRLGDMRRDVELVTGSMMEMKAALSLNVAMAPAALQMCYVAMGWADLTYFSYISPWDVAGGMAIVHALGGHTDSYPAGHIRDGRHHLARCLVSYNTQRRIDVVDRELQKVATLLYPEQAAAAEQAVAAEKDAPSEN